MKDTKQKPTANSIPDYIFYFLLITSLSLSLKTILVLKNTDTSFTKNLGKNWSSSPLTHFSQTKKNCKINEISLINNSWEGTKIGCDPKSKQKNFLSKSSNANICKNTIIPFKIWKGETMCGQKTEMNYFDNEIVETIEECAINNLKPCGRIDTNNNILCIEKNENCPFNYDKNFSNTNSLKKTKNFSEKLSVKFEGKKYLVKKTQKLKSNPKFKKDLNSADIPFIPVEFIIEADTKEKYDFSYTKLDTAIKTIVFKENNILNANQEVQKNHKGDLSLFSRSFVGIKKQCLDKIKSQGYGDMIINDLLNSDEHNKEIITILQICVFASLLALIVEKFFLINLWNKEYYTTLIIFYFYFSIVFISLSYNLINTLLQKSLKFNGISQIMEGNCMGDLEYQSIKGYFFSFHESIFMISMILLLNLFLFTCEIYKLTIAFDKSSISSSFTEKGEKKELSYW